MQPTRRGEDDACVQDGVGDERRLCPRDGEPETPVRTVAGDAGQLLRLVDAAVQGGLAKYARFVLPTERIARLSSSLSISAYGSP